MGSKNIYYIIPVLLTLLGGIPLVAQETMDTISGQVSYKTSQNIYVRFKSTEGISVGDTLYEIANGTLSPLLAVKNLSSTSCVGTPFSEETIETGTRVIARMKIKKKAEVLPVEINQMPEVPETVTFPQDEESITSRETEKKIKKTDKLTGRISAASYVYFSEHPENDKQRMRYTFTMNAKQIGNTRLSAESYISFRHTLNEWQEVKENFGKTFKVYNLALQYSIKDGTNFWFGRKINHNISNVGAIDGVQAEKQWKKTLAGVFAGSRPDHEDYGFNMNLLQFGAYAGYKADTKNGSIQSTIAVAEQRNNGMTDRRFAYLQHLNSAIRNIYIFTSFEFDLYTLENDKPKNTFDVSSLYASLRYRPSDKISIFGSYDARKNIIYYETYKNFIDQLLEDETRQGLRLSFNYHPLKKITIGASAGYRFQKDNPVASKNLYSYLTISRIPKLDISATLSTVWIQSAYLDGLIYGIRVSRDILKGKIYGEAEYRIVENEFKSSEISMKQSLAGANLSWRLTKKFSVAINYEGEFRDKELSNRIYTNIIQRL